MGVKIYSSIVSQSKLYHGIFFMIRLFIFPSYIYNYHYDKLKRNIFIMEVFHDEVISILDLLNKNYF